MKTILLIAALLLPASITFAGDYRPAHPEKYIGDPFVKQKFDQLEQRERGKSESQEKAARKAQEAAEEKATDGRREAAYSQAKAAHRAKVKKMKKAAGSKPFNSWQLNH